MHMHPANPCDVKENVIYQTKHFLPLLRGPVSDAHMPIVGVFCGGQG